MAKQVIKETLDEVIRAEYPQFGTPVDQIVISTDLAAEFTGRVNAKLPADAQVDVETTKRRLMTLRKRGQANGGLPRLQYDYFGRETTPRQAVKPR